jgi:hypothetical protein
MQNLKAVAMGVVAAIEFVWSNVANPAMELGLLRGQRARETGA